MNIRDRLLEEAVFEPAGTFRDRRVMKFEDLLLFDVEGIHLYMEEIDREIGQWWGSRSGVDAGDRDPVVELIVFLSRHRSEKGVTSLTVHHPGNFLESKYGGRSGMLPPSAPFEITAALKSLYNEKKGLGIRDQTTYEVTHHGPFIETPSFFIEIGSDESRWGLPDRGRAIARALLSNDFRDPRKDLPVAVGVGGGHYAPRFTDRAMRNKFAFGHMVPDYILTAAVDIAGPIRLAVEATPGVEYLVLHRSNRNEGVLGDIESVAGELGLKLV